MTHRFKTWHLKGGNEETEQKGKKRKKQTKGIRHFDGDDIHMGPCHIYFCK